jgi:hypothetical protein
MKCRVYLPVAITLVLLAATIGCTAKKADTFTLPKGDAERGKEAFIHFRCYDCHRVAGVELPPGEELDQVVVELGGNVDRPRQYSELVTAIINPSHRLAQGYTPSLVSKDGKSRMTVYNDVMTVSQLLDLVSFLQAHYNLDTNEQTHYRNYYNP